MNEEKMRVCHIPQIPCEAFEVQVNNIMEAKKIIDLLASYDKFQYENKIKPDYSSASYVEVYDDEHGWTSWMDEETGIDDIYEYFEHYEK